MYAVRYLTWAYVCLGAPVIIGELVKVQAGSSEKRALFDVGIKPTHLDSN